MKKLIFMFSLILSLSLLSADEFNMKDMKGVNNVLIMLDSPLEPFSGTGDGISGKVNFDPANPKSLKGKINLEAKSVKMSNQKMTEVMHNEQWLHVEKNPEITFEFLSVESATSKGEGHELSVKSKLTLKGVTKELVIKVHVTHLPDKLGERMKPELKGDLIALRSVFKIKRSDFGIMSGKYLSKVADEIEITAKLIGTKYK